MIKAVSIEPMGVYDDTSLQASIGISPTSLAQARRSGKLRFARTGKRVLYLGRWIIEWLEQDAAEGRQEVADAK
jgi:hypothetical protein